MMLVPEDLSELLLPAPIGGGFRLDGYWVWCGSAIRGGDGRFHLFASRWPKYLPFHPGWITDSEIVRAAADRPEGPYEFEEVVLPARGADYWDGRSTHNPHITRHGDTYILYYTGSTHPFPDTRPGEGLTTDDPRCITGRANKRVGLATSRSVLGPWERRDQPILPARPGKHDSFLTSNPAPCVHEDGSVLLVYKARAYKPRPYEGHLHGGMTLGAARADHFGGPYRVISDGPLFPPERFNLEDPFIWRTADGYGMIAKDMEGNVCGERYAGICARSRDGLHWQAEMGRKAYSRRIRWDDGSERILRKMERLFLLFQEGRPTHAFFAADDGPDGSPEDTPRNTWNLVIPLLRP